MKIRGCTPGCRVKEESCVKVLRNAYIKFRTAEDRTQGCAELLAHSTVARLSNDVFCIPWKSLALLDACEVEYTFASQDDLSDARPLWNFAAAR